MPSKPSGEVPHGLFINVALFVETGNQWWDDSCEKLLVHHMLLSIKNFILFYA
jgi:hypothetical protein